MAVQGEQGFQVQLLAVGRGRDRQLVGFIGRHGVVCIEHVMSALGVRRAQAYRRVAACIERGLLERLDLLTDEPSLLRATRDGLRYAGLGLPLADRLTGRGRSPAALRHHRAAPRRALRPRSILTERELLLAEQLEERLIASAKLGEDPGGRQHLHHPDLVILTEDRPIAIEVELTPKAPHRLGRSSAPGAAPTGWRRSTTTAPPARPAARSSARSPRCAPRSGSESWRWWRGEAPPPATSSARSASTSGGW